MSEYYYQRRSNQASQPPVQYIHGYQQPNAPPHHVNQTGNNYRNTNNNWNTNNYRNTDSHWYKNIERNRSSYNNTNNYKNTNSYSYMNNYRNTSGFRSTNNYYYPAYDESRGMVQAPRRQSPLPNHLSATLTNVYNKCVDRNISGTIRYDNVRPRGNGNFPLNNGYGSWNNNVYRRTQNENKLQTGKNRLPSIYNAPNTVRHFNPSKPRITIDEQISNGKESGYVSVAENITDNVVTPPKSILKVPNGRQHKGASQKRVIFNETTYYKCFKKNDYIIYNKHNKRQQKSTTTTPTSNEIDIHVKQEISEKDIIHEWNTTNNDMSKNDPHIIVKENENGEKEEKVTVPMIATVANMTTQKEPSQQIIIEETTDDGIELNDEEVIDIYKFEDLQPIIEQSPSMFTSVHTCVTIENETFQQQMKIFLILVYAIFFGFVMFFSFIFYNI